MIPLEADRLMSEDRKPKMKITVHVDTAKVTKPLRIGVLSRYINYCIWSAVLYLPVV